MLIMTSIIRVGQAKTAIVPGTPIVQIDEDSTERIMNCISTLSELQTEEEAIKEIFLHDTRKAFERMVGAQEVISSCFCRVGFN
jgi:coatomer subunit beta